MTKQTIKWHEEGYNNWKISLDKHEERVLKELEKIKEDRTRLEFRKFQIDEAKRLNMESYDVERFRVSRKPQKSNNQEHQAPAGAN